MSPSACPAQDSFYMHAAVWTAAQGTRGLCPGQRMQLLFSCSQFQPVANVSTCSRLMHTEDTDTDSHTNSHKEGTAFNSTHTGLTPDTSPHSHFPSSSWTGRLIRTHTTLPRFSRVHTQSQIPQHWHGSSAAWHPCPHPRPS